MNRLVILLFCIIIYFSFKPVKALENNYILSLRDNYDFSWKEENNNYITSYDLKLSFEDTLGNSIEGMNVLFEIGSDKLAGASFVLTNKDGLYYQAMDSEGSVITSIANTDGLVEVRWVEDYDVATILVTDDLGIITFKGLENGTYYLVEIEAPKGYNKLNKEVEIKVGHNEEGLVNYAVSHEEVVMNSSGFALPITGGIGSKIFVFGGLLISGISGMVLIASKKHEK